MKQRVDLQGGLALLNDQMGRRDAALENYQTAIQLSKDGGDAYREAVNRGNLAELLGELQRYHESLSQFAAIEVLLPQVLVKLHQFCLVQYFVKIHEEGKMMKLLAILNSP